MGAGADRELVFEGLGPVLTPRAEAEIGRIFVPLLLLLRSVFLFVLQNRALEFLAPPLGSALLPVPGQGWYPSSPGCRC